MSQKIKIIVIDGIILLVIILSIVLFMMFKPKFNENNISDYQVNGGKVKVKTSITLPLGSKVPNVQDLVKYNKSSGSIQIYYENDLITSNTLDKIGTYKAIINVDDATYESNIIVEDNEAPVLEIKDVTIKLKNKYSINDFIETCSDNSKENCKIEYANDEMGEYIAVGTYEIDIIARDESGNETKGQAKLTIEGSNSAASNDNTNEITKYGVKIKTIVENGITKIEYDRTDYNATTEDMLEEATNLINTNKKQINDVLKYTNEYRAKVGVSNLELDNELSKAAMIRAMEMAYAKKVSNERPNDKAWNTVLDELNINTKQKAQNVAAMQYSAKMATDWWGNSNAYYKNIINKNFKKMGVGYIYIPVDHKYYWVQIFSD